MADFSQMSDEQLAGCVSSAESGEAVAEMVSRYTGLVLALAGKYSGGADYEELVSDGLDALLSAAEVFPGEGELQRVRFGVRQQPHEERRRPREAPQ